MPVAHALSTRAGDTLSHIAKQNGYGDWREIYNAPENAPFRQKRPNPNVIYPGDRLILPNRGGGTSAPPPPAIVGDDKTPSCSLGGPPGSTVVQRVRLVSAAGEASTDEAIMDGATADARTAMLGAIAQLTDMSVVLGVAKGFHVKWDPKNLDLTRAQRLKAICKWLKTDPNDAAALEKTIEEAKRILEKALNARTSDGAIPATKRVAGL